MKHCVLRYLILMFLVVATCSSVSSQAQQVLPQNKSDAVESMTERTKNFYQFAILGDPEAQYQLANCYHKGYGVEANDSLAFEWAKKSAEQDYPSGLYILAYFYETGRGCSHNMSNANYLYKRAYEKALRFANKGDAMAQFVVGKVLDYGNGGIIQNQPAAVRWYRRAAEQGYSGAQFNLGNCLQLGDGVNKDQKQAVYWYREAALQDDADAQYMLALCYATGDGVTKSNRKAIEWFKRSSRLGNRLAQQILLSINETW